eukprot:gene1192-biopygen5779
MMRGAALLATLGAASATPLSPTVLAIFFDEFDTDSSGSISVAEFNAYYKNREFEAILPTP